MVASEVKELAKQTAAAAGDISGIEKIQADTGTATNVIETINQAINKVNENTKGIVVAVEEQAKTTNIVSDTVHTATTKVNEITHHISSVKESAIFMIQAVKGSNASIVELERLALELGNLVSYFKLENENP